MNVTAAQSDQTSQITNSKVVTVTGAPATSYVGVTNLGFLAAAPAITIGNTVQWSFVGPGSHSATDKTTGLGLFPDTGLVAPVAFRQTIFPAAGAYTFTDTATANTIKLNVAMTAAPATGSTSTTFTLTWATAAPPAGYAEDVQVTVPGFVDVGVALQGDDRHVGDVRAQQGHRQVQVPGPVPQHDQQRRLGLHDQRHHHRQLSLTPVRGDQAGADGVAGQVDLVSRADLVAQVLAVALDRPRADHQHLRDLARGVAVGDQARICDSRPVRATSGSSPPAAVRRERHSVSG